MASIHLTASNKSHSQQAAIPSDGTSLNLSDLLLARFTHASNTQHAHMALGPWLGPFRSKRRGHGLDFDDMRPYLVGDDIRHIDWKATARQNELFTRLYKEEKEQLITLAVDFSCSMFTGSQQLKSVRAALLTAKLAWHICNAGARCAVHVQTDSGAVQLPAANGEQAAINICATLHKQFEAAKTAAHNTNNAAHNKASAALSMQLDRLINGGRTLGVVMLIGGLDHFDQLSQQQFLQLAKARKMAMLYVADPLELNRLPTGHYRYQTANGPSTIHVGKAQQRAIQQNLKNQQHALKRFFSDSQIPFLSEDCDAQVLLNALSHYGLIP